MIQCRQSNNNKEKPARVPGRRSSKPLMEKRRRARINTCLEILKSYVLKETTENMKISSTSEVTIENKNTIISNTRATSETIAITENIEQFLISELKNNKKSILKNSNIANKGRRNPNKLEKADILELTVDYVRRLHEERDRLQLENCRNSSNGINMKSQDHYLKANNNSSNNNDVSLTLQIEQLIRIPGSINSSNLENAVSSPIQTTTTTTTTTNLTANTNYLMQSSNGLLPLSVRTTPNQVPPSPPSSASTSPLSVQHFISSTTDDDYYGEPLSMVVCDNSRLRERQPRPWRPWDVNLN